MTRKAFCPDTTADCAVVVPALGYAEVLPATLESVLAQTLPPSEIIVLAMDESSHVAASRFPVTVVRHNPLVLSDARNALIDLTNTVAILPLDSDDLIAPTYLEQTYALIRDGAADVVSTAVTSFGSRSGPHAKLSTGNTVTLDSLLRGNQLPYCSLFRRSCWAAVGGYWTHPCYEDWALWVSFARNGYRFVRIPAPLFMYRTHSNPSLNVRCKQQHERWYSLLRAMALRAT
jgi:glycosyltransferase involved in cell wall biosynthesis